MLSLLTYGNAFPQSVEFALDIPDLQKWDRESQEYPILKDLVKSQASTIARLDQSLAEKTKELDLEKRENALNQREKAVKDMEIAALNNANDRLKDVSDRAIKLAETAKPKSFEWYYLIPLVGLIGFVIGAL